ncbi:hypothetical protein GGER_26940 [Serratia rubidaea]
MVKCLIFIILLTGIMRSVAAGHIPLRKITEVKVDEVGKSEDTSENVRKGCQTFNITVAEVKDFSQNHILFR